MNTGSEHELKDAKPSSMNMEDWVVSVDTA